MEAEKPSHEALTQALSTALERTLTAHTQRMEAVEKKTLDQAARVMEQLSALQHEIGRQSAALAGLQEGEAQLARLQDSLNKNIEAVAAAGVLQDAVHSLTAAVHLLTARGGGNSRKAA